MHEQSSVYVFRHPSFAPAGDTIGAPRRSVSSWPCTEVAVLRAREASPLHSGAQPSSGMKKAVPRTLVYGGCGTVRDFEPLFAPMQLSKSFGPLLRRGSRTT